MNPKHIKVFGPGCKRCHATAEMIESEAQRLGVTITLEHITDYAEMAANGVTATPGVMVEGKLVHAGGLPELSKIETWLR